VSRLLAAVALLGAASLTACGGGGGGDGGYREPRGPAQETISVQGGNFFFEPDEIELPAGINEIEMESEQGVHTLLIEGVDGYELRTRSTGDTDAKKVRLRPGEYDFWCDVPGHREGGMEGTLTVTRANSAPAP
jgi:plastocyanin